MTSAPQDRFHGLYQGEVMNNIDPEQRGRLQVKVTDVACQEPEIWAEAASPVSGAGMGFYAVPAVGTTVWVSFVGGSVRDAVWLGNPHETFKDLPGEVITNTNPITPPVMLFTKEGHNVAMIDGVQLQGGLGGIFLQHAAGPSLEITAEHIKLTWAPPGGAGPSSTIELNAAGVSINGTALTVSNLGV